MNNTTRGLRNNNPLNLRPSGDNWIGLREPQTDPGYLQFDTSFHGLRAGAKNLITYYRVHKRQNVASIITNWAPPSDSNPTNHYIATVCEHLGVNPDQRINLDNGDVLRRLMEVMIRVECGSQPFSRIDLETAINAAYASHSAPPIDPPVTDVTPVQPENPPAEPHKPKDQITPATPPLVNQPSLAPTRKLIAGGIAGTVAVIIMVLWNRFLPGYELPLENAEEIAGLVILAVTLVTQYFTRNRAIGIPPANPAPDRKTGNTDP